MTPSNEEIVHALKRAKDRLNTGRHNKVDLTKELGICGALSHSGVDGNPYVNSWIARNLIMNRLDGHCYVGSWMIANIPECRKMRDKGDFTIQVLQEYRHRWVDGLIKEFS